MDGERRIQAFEFLNKEEIEYTEYPEHTIGAEASANMGLHFDVVEAVAIWNAMESYQGQLMSESDTSEKRRERAAKFTGYSTTILILEFLQT